MKRKIRVSISDGVNYIEEVLRVSSCDDVEALVNGLIDEEVDETWGQNILVLQSEVKEETTVDSTI